MKILALDLGKFKTVACEFDTDSGEYRYEKIKMAPFIVQQLFAATRPDRIVFEVGPAAGWVHDIAEQFGVEIQVANPNTEGWQWRNVKAKTDRLDALKLARFSFMGQLPKVYVPSQEVRQRRSMIVYRNRLVQRRTQIKNRIRALLHSQGLSHKSGKGGWTIEQLNRLHEMACPLDEVATSDLWRGQLYEELEGMDDVGRHLFRVEKKLDELNKSDHRVALLRTIPGVGARTAEALVSVIDDPHRFKRSNQLGSYLGLVPKQFESGKTSRMGRITKQGNALLRGLLIEASWISLRYNPHLRAIYERVKSGSPSRHKQAIVATARRLLVIAWAMLRDGSRWKPPRILEQVA